MLSTVRSASRLLSAGARFGVRGNGKAVVRYQLADSVRTVTNAAGGTGSDGKLKAAPMVYISGEEMTKYTMELVMQKWIQPYVDYSNWEFYDLSCKARSDTDDQVGTSVDVRLF